MNKYQVKYRGVEPEIEHLAGEYADLLQVDEVRQGVYQVLGQRHGPESVVNALTRFLVMASALERGRQKSTPPLNLRTRMANALGAHESTMPPAIRDLFHTALAPAEMRRVSLEYWTYHLAEAKGHELSDEERGRLADVGEMFLDALKWIESPEDAPLTRSNDIAPCDQGGAQ